MKKIMMLCSLIIFLMSIRMYAQESQEQKIKIMHIGVGLGFKYHTDRNTNKHKPKIAFTAELAKDFWGTGKHFVGLEIIGHDDTYGSSPMSPKDFSLILNILYKRNAQLFDKIMVETDIGFCLFSNDLASFLAPFVNIQMTYVLDDFDLFIKNNFRVAFPLFNMNIPWILSAGITFKI